MIYKTCSRCNEQFQAASKLIKYCPACSETQIIKKLNLKADPKCLQERIETLELLGWTIGYVASGNNLYWEASNHNRDSGMLHSINEVVEWAEKANK
jgi:predicted RNA-binding Zn-ribbon protein involved in translation (DUF1610 family)